LLFDAADLEIQEHLQALSRPSVRHLLGLEKAIVAWAEESRAPTAATLAYSAGVPARIAESLLIELEEAGLVTRDAADAIKLAVPLATFRTAARDFVAKVKTFRFEGERKLKSVEAYALSEDCRSVFIRRYFGEANPPRCGTCDRCRAGAPIASTIEARPEQPRRRRRRRRPRRRSAASGANSS
jgi:hypothetical protein